MRPRSTYVLLPDENGESTFARKFCRSAGTAELRTMSWRSPRNAGGYRIAEPEALSCGYLCTQRFGNRPHALPLTSATIWRSGPMQAAKEKNGGGIPCPEESSATDHRHIYSRSAAHYGIYWCTWFPRNHDALGGGTPHLLLNFPPWPLLFRCICTASTADQPSSKSGGRPCRPVQLHPWITCTCGGAFDHPQYPTPRRSTRSGESLTSSQQPRDILRPSETAGFLRPTLCARGDPIYSAAAWRCRDPCLLQSATACRVRVRLTPRCAALQGETAGAFRCIRCSRSPFGPGALPDIAWRAPSSCGPGRFARSRRCHRLFLG
jgi:hypothetical protein